MLETAVAQLRFAYSLALGRPFHTPSLEHLIAAIRDTRREFGPTAVGAHDAELISGPRLDDSTRKDMRPIQPGPPPIQAREAQRGLWRRIPATAIRANPRTLLP